MAIAGKTPLVSHVNNIIFYGCDPIDGRWAFFKKFKGNVVFTSGLYFTS